MKILMKTIFYRYLIVYGLVLIIAGLHGYSFADDLLDYDPSKVISRVMETYSRVYSARGRITRTVEAGGENLSFSGRFAVKRPDRLLVEFVGDDHQLTVNDGKTFRVYFPKENQGLYSNINELSPPERFLMGPEPFFGNILLLMEKGFTFEAADMVEGNLILKAAPLKPLQFNFILIAIDPETWTIHAVENFNRQNQLVSQTRFLEFKTLGDSLFFPVTVKTSTILGENVMIETTHLTRVQLNVMFDEDMFRIPDNEDTEWIKKSR